MPKNAPILVECAGRWRNLVFSSFFFRPTSSCRHHVFFYLYSKCLLCLSARSEDMCVINSYYPLSSLDFSTFLLSFLDFFPVTFRPILVNSTRDFLLLSFNVVQAALFILTLFTHSTLLGNQEHETVHQVSRNWALAKRRANVFA